MPITSPDEDSQPPGPDHDNTAVLREKDAMIENLRFEIAEIQFNAAQQGHAGEGRFQDLEKQITELKLQNGRLADENETFQLLLSEKTLKGDFAPDHQETSGLNSLAEELSFDEDNPDTNNDAYRKLEAENKQLKESGKALTLYIDKIIGRILMHEGFEHIITGKDDKEDGPPPPPPARAATFSNSDKALPPPPPGDAAAAVQNAAAGFLQRARSVGMSHVPSPSLTAITNIPSLTNRSTKTTNVYGPTLCPTYSQRKPRHRPIHSSQPWSSSRSLRPSAARRCCRRSTTTRSWCRSSGPADEPRFSTTHCFRRPHEPRNQPSEPAIVGKATW
jgi:hypothetical protein